MSPSTFAFECAPHELAEKLDLDLIELRRRIEPGATRTTGKPFSSRYLIEAYEQGAERFGWRNRSQTPAQKREGEWRSAQLRHRDLSLPSLLRWYGKDQG